MKRKYVCSMVALLLTAALFTGCAAGKAAQTAGAADPGSPANAPEEVRVVGNGVRLSGEPLDMPEAGIRLKEAAKTGNGAFLYGLDEDDRPRFFRLDADSEEIQSVAGLEAEGVQAVSASPDGALHALALTAEGAYEILSLSDDGTTDRLTLDGSLYTDGSILDFEAVDKGFFLAVSGQPNRAIAIDKNGKLVEDYGRFRSISIVKLRQDLTLLIFHGDTGENGPADPLDAAGARIVEIGSDFAPGESYTAQTIFTSCFPGAEGELLGQQNGIIYRYDYRSDRAEAVVNAFTSGMNSVGMVCLGAERYLSIDRGAPYIWRPSAGGAVQVLTLATYDMDLGLRMAIRDFNAQNGDYMVEPIDYSAYDTYDSQSTGLTMLAADILSGKAPDIYDLSLFSPENYAAKGLLEDLKPWFETDEDMAYEDLIPSVAAAAEFNGGLYELIPSFHPVTLAGDHSVVGSAWTVEDFIRLTKEVPHERILGLDMTREEFLGYVLAFMHGELYSEETLTCDFTSENFLAMLEFAASLPERFAYDGSGSQGVANGRAYAGEQLLVMSAHTYIVEEISFLDAIFSGEAQFVGFPTDGGSGFGMMPAARLAMSSSSADKNGVWAFFKYLLSDSVQAEGRYFRGLPVMSAALDKKLDLAIKNAMESPPKAYTASTAGPVEIDGVPVDESMKERVHVLIGKIDCITACDETILDIVMDCAAPFYAGDKTARQAAEDIQSRVKIYLSEQYG